VLLKILVHDAHPRAQSVLALKTAGFDLPGEDDLWLAWRQR
jgi:hypothetical protein